jgi:hypothetical protein
MGTLKKYVNLKCMLHEVLVKRFDCILSWNIFKILTNS